MERRCENCGGSIAHKSSRARFCSSICRSEHWRYGDADQPIGKEQSKKEQLIPKSKSFEASHIYGLKGVLDDKSDTPTIPTKKPNPLYGKIKKILNHFVRQVNTQRYQLKQLISQKDNLEYGREGFLPVAGTLGGMFINLPKTAEDEKGKVVESNWLRLGAIALGLGGGFLAKKAAKKNREQSLVEVKTRISKMTKTVQNLKDKIALCKVRLSKTDKYIELQEPESNLYDITSETSIKPSDEVVQSYDPILTDEKIICSNDLMKMDFKSLDFQGEWQTLFGNPAVSFHLVVHGKPGQGKSTFCLQFAHYLACNFGKVLYVSGEEGFSKTMKDKFQNNNAFNKNLYLADIHSFEELTENVAPNTFHFLFIDSLNNMGIDILRLKELREIYRNSTLITISQSTKKGNLRGSLEIEHEADVSIKVEDGFAYATKNRFKELGFEYSIFK